MSNVADVIVIGSGIVGSSTAYYLARKGLKVLVLERDNIGDGASSRNGAGVRLSSRVFPESALAEEAVKHIWPTLGEELDADLEYTAPGSLCLAQTEAQMKALQGSLKKSMAYGVEAHLIDGDEARKICPCLSDKVNQALWYPEDGYANPMVTTLAYYRKNRKMGVRYITGEDVRSIKKYRGRARKVITAAGNVYEADKIVVAAGFNSKRIAETVGIWLPFLKRVDECIITEAVAPLTKLRLSTADGNFYGHQTKHGSFIFGGNTNLERYESTYDQRPRNTNKQSSDKCRAVSKYIPALRDVKVIRQWAGWLDSTIDRLPIIQEIPEVPGMILSCGYSGHGFAIGPAAGKVTSQVVLGEEPIVDISSLCYNRFKPSGC